MEICCNTCPPAAWNAPEALMIPDCFSISTTYQLCAHSHLTNPAHTPAVLSALSAGLPSVSSAVIQSNAALYFRSDRTSLAVLPRSRFYYLNAIKPVKSDHPLFSNLTKNVFLLLASPLPFSPFKPVSPKMPNMSQKAPYLIPLFTWNSTQHCFCLCVFLYFLLTSVVQSWQGMNLQLGHSIPQRTNPII